MTREEADRILYMAVSIGEELLCCGAEAARVEDTVSRVVLAYGADDIDVFSLPSTIFATVTFNGTETKTQSRRVRHPDIDMSMQDELNKLSREICETTPETELIEERLKAIRNGKKHSFFMQIAAYVFISAGFAVFFGGNAMDGIAAGIIGALLKVFETGLSRISSSRIMDVLLLSLAGGFLARFSVMLGFGAHADFISIGNIMIFIPGIAFTSSLRELFLGETLAGLMRFFEALTLSAVIAFGFVFAGSVF